MDEFAEQTLKEVEDFMVGIVSTMIVHRGSEFAADVFTAAFTRIEDALNETQ